MQRLNLVGFVNLCFVFFLGSSHASSAILQPPILKVKENYVSEWDHSLNLDSIAAWHRSSEDAWLIVTSKHHHDLTVFDASTGKVIKKHGKKGTQRGQFNRPNGIAVIDHLLFVVERDNHRVQVLELPSLRTISIFGSGTLKKPYGISVFRLCGDNYAVYVTDDYSQGNIHSSTDSNLQSRVQQFSFSIQNKEVYASLIRKFGESTGEGVLKKVESIFVDSEREKVLVADELSKNIKIYSLEGKFLNRVIGQDLFQGEPEGMALYSTPESNGYWVFTEQNKTAETNIFHIFDRDLNTRLGSFFGERTANTDGIWITPFSFPGYPKGGLFVLNDDGGVNLFSWEELSKLFNLK